MSNFDQSLLKSLTGFHVDNDQLHCHYPHIFRNCLLCILCNVANVIGDEVKRRWCQCDVVVGMSSKVDCSLSTQQNQQCPTPFMLFALSLFPTLPYLCSSLIFI